MPSLLLFSRLRSECPILATGAIHIIHIGRVMRAKRVLRYIELKTGYSDNGPAWIGYVRMSRTSHTIYFNGRAFSRIARGRYRDVETREVFWISGVKKNAEDRHWAGSGKVLVEKGAAPEYLSLIGATKLDPSKYSEFEPVMDVDLEKFHRLANRSATDDTWEDDEIERGSWRE
jgi:hypothetical protein